jgi:hypothetical protein
MVYINGLKPTAPNDKTAAEQTAKQSPGDPALGYWSDTR